MTSTMFPMDERAVLDAQYREMGLAQYRELGCPAVFLDPTFEPLPASASPQVLWERIQDYQTLFRSMKIKGTSNTIDKIRLAVRLSASDAKELIDLRMKANTWESRQSDLKKELVSVHAQLVHKEEENFVLQAKNQELKTQVDAVQTSAQVQIDTVQACAQAQIESVQAAAQVQIHATQTSAQAQIHAAHAQVHAAQSVATAMNQKMMLAEATTAHLAMKLNHAQSSTTLCSKERNLNEIVKKLVTQGHAYRRQQTMRTIGDAGVMNAQSVMHHVVNSDQCTIKEETVASDLASDNTPLTCNKRRRI